MTSIPLFFALAPFVIFLVIFFIFTFFNFFHIAHYGPHGFAKFVVMGVYFAGTVFLLGGSYLVLARYDWQQPIDLSAYAQENGTIDPFHIPDVPLKTLER